MKSRIWPFSEKFIFWQKPFKSNFFNFKFFKLGRFYVGLGLVSFTWVYRFLGGCEGGNGQARSTELGPILNKSRVFIYWCFKMGPNRGA